MIKIGAFTPILPIGSGNETSQESLRPTDAV
jgi:hypothetical protein